MSKRELTRLEVVQRVQRRRLTQREAAALLGLSVRQVERLCRAYRERGVDGLVSKRRGAPSNNQINNDLRTAAMALVHAEYSDFGPTLAQEQLAERHGINVSRETLRKWMVTENVWVPRAQRQRVFQRRHRRACIGELVQIDGCDHEWFEDRAPRCTALVYVDDATGALMEVRFVESESAFSYFEATRSYLERHGKPLAFYSDRASVFRVAEKRGKTYKTGTQFARAMNELNIDIICANSPQACNRVLPQSSAGPLFVSQTVRASDIAMAMKSGGLPPLARRRCLLELHAAAGSWWILPSVARRSRPLPEASHSNATAFFV